MEYYYAAAFAFIIILSLFNYRGAWSKLDTPKIASSTQRIHSHFLFCNLGIVIGCFLCVPSNIAGKWLFGDLVCTGYAFEAFFAGMTAINLITVIAYNRYYVTIKKKAPIKSDILVIFSWILGLFWSILPLVGYGRYALEYNKTSCGIDFSANSLMDKLYMLGLVIFGFAVPLVLSAIYHYHTKSEESRLNMISKVDLSVNSSCRLIMVSYILSWSLYVYMAIAVMTGFTVTSFPNILIASLAPIAAKFGAAVLPMLYPNVLKHRPSN